MPQHHQISALQPPFGRPNISGIANGIFGLTGTETVGAITKEIVLGNLAGYNGNGGQYGKILFDAARCSDVYGDDGTVQPSSMQSLACIKI